MATDAAGAIFNKDKSHAKQMKWETKKLSKHKRGKWMGNLLNSFSCLRK